MLIIDTAFVYYLTWHGENRLFSLFMQFCMDESSHHHHHQSMRRGGGRRLRRRHLIMQADHRVSILQRR